jgi:hypothetical protein
MLKSLLLNTKPMLAMNFAPCLPAVFVAGSFRQLELLVRRHKNNSKDY